MKTKPPYILAALLFITIAISACTGSTTSEPIPDTGTAQNETLTRENPHDISSLTDFILPDDEHQPDESDLGPTTECRPEEPDSMPSSGYQPEEPDPDPTTEYQPEYPNPRPSSEHQPEKYTPQPTPEPIVLSGENQAEIAPHLEGMIFSARFLNIPTYENSGQTAHPHVLFFAEQFMGYHYVMAVTPYPFANNAHENPSILGSQDGINWEVPEGVANPVVGAPPDIAHGGHYSDPFLLRRGDVLELWFRHTLAVYANGRYVQNNRHNRIYRTISSDLSNWSELETILECTSGTSPFMSVVIMYDDTKYRLWYATYNSSLFYIESRDLINWSERVRVLPGFQVWHHELQFTGEMYEALLVGTDWDNEPQFRLFYATSYDGINFDKPKEIRIQSISPELEGMTVHKSSFVRQRGIYQFYIAAFTGNNVWRMFYFEIYEENLYKLFE